MFDAYDYDRNDKIEGKEFLQGTLDGKCVPSHPIQLCLVLIEFRHDFKLVVQ